MSKATQDTMLQQLKQPFDPKFIKWRVGATNKEKTKGIALAYIDSREVKKRLDDVMGLAGWQDRYIAVDGGFICELSLKIDDEWITKSDAAGNTQVEPIKGGASDALKRAASTWGIGRYLYYLPNVWVDIKPKGKSYELAEIPQLPDWALPNVSIERWEDVAELELVAMNAASDGEDGDVEDDTLDKVKNAKTEEDLNAILADLSAEDKKAFTTVIKHRLDEVRNVTSN